MKIDNWYADVKGIVIGKTVYLLFFYEDKLYYSARLRYKGTKTLKGKYIKGLAKKEKDFDRGWQLTLSRN